MHSRGIGFLSDVRRMNVVLTRAKFFCLSLPIMDPYWADLVSHAKDASSVIRVPVNRQNKTFAELASLKALQPEAKPIMPSSKRIKKDTNRVKR
jgi:senataxin